MPSWAIDGRGGLLGPPRARGEAFARRRCRGSYPEQMRRGLAWAGVFHPRAPGGYLPQRRPERERVQDRGLRQWRTGGAIVLVSARVRFHAIGGVSGTLTGDCSSRRVPSPLTVIGVPPCTVAPDWPMKMNRALSALSIFCVFADLSRLLCRNILGGPGADGPRRGHVRNVWQVFGR